MDKTEIINNPFDYFPNPEDSDIFNEYRINLGAHFESPYIQNSQPKNKVEHQNQNPTLITPSIISVTPHFAIHTIPAIHYINRLKTLVK